MSTDTPDPNAVETYLRTLQERICSALESEDGTGTFCRDAWDRPGGGGGLSRVLEGGSVFEKAGVGFSRVTGERLPPSATAHRPDLAGLPWEAMGVSLVLHPRNPRVPTSHANVRFFLAGAGTGNPAWWFGGGYDLTPYYGYEEDCVHWHTTARQALEPFPGGLYPRFKDACDRYFHLRHRNEPRGIGGVFFDDFHELGADRSFSVMRAVGDSFLPAYLPIVRRRHGEPYGERERDWQLYRRGRYAEFNLVWDRGTLFGLQSGGRTESILMSLPPLVRWDYNRVPEPGSEESRLHTDFLKPRDWA